MEIIIQRVTFAIICVVSFIIGKSSSTNFTVIYDSLFKHQFVHAPFRKENHSGKIDLLEITEGHDNLQNLTTKLETVSKDGVVYLFTKKNRLHEQMLNHQNLILKYGLSIEQMIENNSGMSNSYCFTFNKRLQKVLTLLIYNVADTKIAVVTNDNNCSKTFYNALERSVSSSQYRENLQVNIYHVIYHEEQPLQRTNTQNHPLYALRSLDVQLIILLIPNQQLSVILEGTDTIGVIDSTIWLIPSFRDDLVTLKWKPGKLLSFDIGIDSNLERNSNKHFYGNLTRSLAESMLVYEDSVNSLQNSEELSMHMFQTVMQIENEERNNNTGEKIRLKFRYRSKDKLSQRWIYSDGEINQESLHIYKNNIPILNSLTEKTANEYITVVTIIDEPYTTDRKDMYDSLLGTCTMGLKCKKPVQRNNTIVYEPTCCGGYTVELFMLIIKYIGLKVNMYVVEDGSYGTLGRDGKWNGMIGDLVEGKADVALAGLTITESRSRVVNFTLPYLESEMGILVKPQIVHLDFINFEFLQPLNWELQFFLWLIIVGTMVVNFTLENSIYITSLTKKEYVEEKYYSTYESMTYISGVALQRDMGGVNPKRPGARFAAIVFAFGMVIVVTTYTAVLAAQNMQHVEKNPFKGSKDSRMRYPTSKFRFGTVVNTSYIAYFKESEIEFVQRIHHFMKQYNVKNTEEGVGRVKNGDLEAFIGDYQLLYWYISNDKSCELRVQKDTLLHPAGYGFAMRRGFKWAIRMNQGVLRYRESKELAKLYKKWFKNACEQVTTGPKTLQLGINHFGGIIFILSVTALACFPILIPEHGYYRFLEKVVKRKAKRILKMQSYHLNSQDGEDKEGIVNQNFEVNKFFEELQKRYNPTELYKDVRTQREEALAKFDD